MGPAKDVASNKSSRSSSESSASSAASNRGRQCNMSFRKRNYRSTTSDGEHRQRNLDLTSRDIIIRERSRSTALTSGRAGQRGGSRSASGRWQSQGRGVQKSTSVCWNGWNCTRQHCWFQHPEGRKVDQRKRSRSDKCSRSKSSGHGGHFEDRSSSESSESVEQQASSKRSPRRRSRSLRKVALAASTPKSTKSAKTEQTGKRRKRTLLDFRSFVMKHTRDDDPPEVALARFERYRVEFAEISLAALKEHGKGLLFDMYNPLAVARFHDLRVLAAREAACAFMRDWRSGGFDGLALQSAAVNLSPLPSGTPCQVYGLLEAPHHALDPEFGSLTLSDVPTQVSILDILDKVWSFPGFVAFAVTKPDQEKLMRQVKVRFETTTQARAALEALLEFRPWGEATPVKATQSVPAVKLEGTLLSPEFTNRIIKDLDLAKSVAERLDKLIGIPEEVTDFIMSANGGLAATTCLDMLVLYLRRVHHFCFFNASWCADDWELTRQHGAAVLRQLRPDSEVVDADSQAVKAHETRIANFLDTASLRMVDLSPSDGDETREQAAISEIYDRNTTEPSTGKFKCGQCEKFFKGPEYVRKHLQKCHGGLLGEVQRRRHGESACRAFLVDSDRPLMASDGQPPCEGQ